MFRRFQTDEEFSIALALVKEASTRLFEERWKTGLQTRDISTQLGIKIRAILNLYHHAGTYIANNIAFDITTIQGDVSIHLKGWEVDPKWIPSERSALTYDSSGAIVRLDNFHRTGY